MIEKTRLAALRFPPFVFLIRIPESPSSSGTGVSFLAPTHQSTDFSTCSIVNHTSKRLNFYEVATSKSQTGLNTDRRQQFHSEPFKITSFCFYTINLLITGKRDRKLQTDTQ
jgi:hypothetical protein